MKYAVFLVLFLAHAILFSQTYQVDSIRWQGPSEKRINLVILGDGYQVDELPKFADDAWSFSEELFNQPPFREYVDYFNVVSIRVPSNESGAARDPSELIDNIFGSTFNFSGIERLLVPTRTSNVISVLANNFPDYDQVVVLVNDSKYGGSGGWLATSSTHSSANEIAIHEIGHSFANLADEYYAGDQFARERPNMTSQNNPDLVKWKNWVGFMGVGVYQHCCDGNSELWYKPHNNCKMQALNRPFCPVCVETFVATIHQLTDAIESYKPEGEFFETESDYINFQVELLHPQPNTLQRLWYLNQALILDNSDTLELATDTLQVFNFIEFWVVDTSSYLRIDDFATWQTEYVAWDVRRISTQVESVNTQNETIDWRLYPLPAARELFLEASRFPPDMTLNIYSMEGKLLQSYPPQAFDQGIIKIDLPALGSGSDGFQLLVVQSQNQIIQSFTIPRVNDR